MEDILIKVLGSTIAFVIVCIIYYIYKKVLNWIFPNDKNKNKKHEN